MVYFQSLEQWRERWQGLFELRRPAATEILLLLLLANSAHDGFFAMIQGEAEFRSSDVFNPWSAGVRPAGWVAWMPGDWVLSHGFYQVVGALVLLSSVCWVLKRLLPGAAILCAAAYGIQVSIEESLMFNYIHEVLPGVFLLVVFAAAYWFRHEPIRRALAARCFWDQPLFPRWIFVMAVAYFGVQYSASGVFKIFLGGWEIFRGTSLQMLYAAMAGPPDFVSQVWLAQPIVQSRFLAAMAMSATVVLETGALLAFSIPRWRPWWALAICGMHLQVLLTMNIPFKMHAAALLWIALPAERMLDYAGARARACLPIRLPAAAPRLPPALARAAYAVDVLGILSPRTPPPGSAAG